MEHCVVPAEIWDMVCGLKNKMHVRLSSEGTTVRPKGAVHDLEAHHGPKYEEHKGRYFEEIL